MFGAISPSKICRRFPNTGSRVIGIVLGVSQKWSPGNQELARYTADRGIISDTTEWGTLEFWLVPRPPFAARVDPIMVADDERASRSRLLHLVCRSCTGVHDWLRADVSASLHDSVILLISGAERDSTPDAHRRRNAWLPTMRTTFLTLRSYGQ